MDFAKKYSYTFEHEATYAKICQINDSDYIAKYHTSEWCKKKYGYIPSDNSKKSGKWTATGKQFQIPYVFKTLFSHQPIEFRDLCVTSSVKTAIYLDMNEKELTHILELCGLKPDEGECVDEASVRKHLRGLKLSKSEIDEMLNDPQIHNYKFVGRVGSFCPIIPGAGGGILLREKDGKYSATAGSKGYRWLEAEDIKKKGLTDKIDMAYFREMAAEMKEAIGKYCDFEWFVSEED
jgi:hypothetical protein